MFKLFGILVLVVLVAAVVAVLSLQSSETWSKAEVVLQTPDEAFENLPDYPFKANYVDSLGYRIHYVDEGPRDGQVVLLMHGQPTWSYLYRHMIPVLADAGYRVIAPDNVGFGKSDKPADVSDHSYQMHIDVMANFVDQLKLENVTYFGQDWGGLIGLRVVAERADRFARVMLSNTALPAAEGIKGWIGYPLFRMSVWQRGAVQKLDTKGEDFDFIQWVAYSRNTENFDFGQLIQGGTHRNLSEAELAAYAAPFPNNDYIAAVRIFPSLVVSQLRQNQAVMDDFYANWDKPLLTAFGTHDELMKGRDKVWQETVPGAQGQPHTLVQDGAHFIQDDKPNEVAQLLIEFIKSNK